MTSLADLGIGLAQTAVEPPLVSLDDNWLRVSATIRMTEQGHIIALCNEYDRTLVDRFRLQLEYQEAKLLEPTTGGTMVLDTDVVTIELEPGRCQLLVTRFE